MIKWRYVVEEMTRVKSLTTGVEVEEVRGLRLDSPVGRDDRAYWILCGAEMGQLQPGMEFMLEFRPVKKEGEVEET